MHKSDNSKTFDSVIVVTDRTVLDDQLQKAIKAIEGTKGVVGTINADEVRKASASSKSALLAKELTSGKLIIIFTLQAFPFVLEALAEQGGLADRKFAVIAADRFNDRYVAAVLDKSKAEVDELDLFRKDVGSFVRLYDFLSQIVDYQDADLEKLALFLRLLRPRLTGRTTLEKLDFRSIELTHIKQTRKSEGTIPLVGEGEKLKPMGVGGGHSRDPHMVAWVEILGNINALFEDEDFDPDSVQSWVQDVVTILVPNESIKDQVNADTKEQFRESQTMEKAVTDAVLDHQDTQNSILEKFFASPHRRGQIVKEISDLVYWELCHQVKMDKMGEDTPEDPDQA